MRYKLLKDFPSHLITRTMGTIPSGTILIADEHTGGYATPHYCFGKNQVENSPEWFELMEEPEFTRKDMLNFAESFRADKCMFGNPAKAFDYWNNHRIQSKEYGKTE